MSGLMGEHVVTPPPPFHKTLHQPMVEHYQCKSYAKFDFQLSSDVTTADN